MQLLQFAQVLDSGDEIALQEQNLKVTTPILDQFDFPNVLLVQRKFFQSTYYQLIVLGLLPDQLLCNYSGDK